VQAFVAFSYDFMYQKLAFSYKIDADFTAFSYCNSPLLCLGMVWMAIIKES